MVAVGEAVRQKPEPVLVGGIILSQRFLSSPIKAGFFMDKSLPELLIIPSQLISDADIKPLDGYVYAVIYWFSKMLLQKCIASNAEIANRLGVDAGSVANSISRLNKKGYIQVVMDDKRHRLEIIPLLTIHQSMKPPSSNDDTPPSSNDEYNSNNKNNKIYTISKDIEAEPNKVAQSSRKLKELILAKDKNSRPIIGKIVDPQVPQTSVVLSSSGKKRPKLTNGRYGNPDINEFLDYFKMRLGLTILDGTEATNRQYTNLLFKKFGGLQNCKLLIDATAQSTFWATKVTSVQKLYYKGVEISSSLRSQKGGVLDASSL